MNNELMNIKLENNNIIKSTDLVEIINYFRHEEGKNDLRHDNFKAKIEKEIERINSVNISPSKALGIRATTIPILIPVSSLLINSFISLSSILTDWC